jgi:hypothetical protein
MRCSGGALTDCVICFELLRPEMDWAQLHITGGGVEEVGPEIHRVDP